MVTLYICLSVRLGYTFLPFSDSSLNLHPRCSIRLLDMKIFLLAIASLLALGSSATPVPTTLTTAVTSTSVTPKRTFAAHRDALDGNFLRPIPEPDVIYYDVRNQPVPFAQELALWNMSKQLQPIFTGPLAQPDCAWNKPWKWIVGIHLRNRQKFRCKKHLSADRRQLLLGKADPCVQSVLNAYPWLGQEILARLWQDLEAFPPNITQRLYHGEYINVRYDLKAMAVSLGGSVLVGLQRYGKLTSANRHLRCIDTR